MRFWKPPHTGLGHDADVSFCLFCLMSWCLSWRSWCVAALTVKKRCRHDVCDMTQRSTVETNEFMKTAAHQSESWCWRQLLSLLSHVLMPVLTQLVCGRTNSQDTMSATWRKGAQLKRMRLWKPPHTSLSHEADVSFCLFCLMSWCLSWRSWCAAALRAHVCSIASDWRIDVTENAYT
jgi:Mn2+/Fe2+ NRAMP family transporter